MMEFTQEELDLLQGLLLVEPTGFLEFSEELDGIDKTDILKNLETARSLYKKIFNNDPVEIFNYIISRIN